MYKHRTGFYHSLIELPDRLFPFKTEVGGQWVRGIRSYDLRLARYQRKYGVGHYGFKLNAYRQFFHFVGSIAFLIVAGLISEAIFTGSDAMYVFLSTAIALISFQEFYLHRRMYQQLWRKGIIDWLTWCLPFGIYLFTHLR